MPEIRARTSVSREPAVWPTYSKPVSILRGCTVTTLTCGGGIAPGAACAWSTVLSQAASRDRLSSAASMGSIAEDLTEDVSRRKGEGRRCIKSSRKVVSWYSTYIHECLLTLIADFLSAHFSTVSPGCIFSWLTVFMGSADRGSNGRKT